MNTFCNLRRGELGSILSILSLLLITTGVIIGSRGTAIQQTKSLLGFAQSSCTYSYTLELRDPATNVILSNISGFQWANDLPAGSSIASSSRPFSSTGLARVVWNPSPLPSDLINKSVSVALNGIPKGYRLQTSQEGDVFFCRSNKSDFSKACQTMRLEPSNPLRLNNIALSCGDNFTYGWYVKADPTAPGVVPPANPAPTTIAPTSSSSALQCTRSCIYSEDKDNNNVPECYQGACPANKPDCGKGVNNGCMYAAAECGNFKSVSCPNGSNPTQAPAPTRTTGAKVCELEVAKGGKGGTCRTTCNSSETVVGFFGCQGPTGNCCVPKNAVATPQPTRATGANVCEVAESKGGKGGTCRTSCIGNEQVVGDYGCSSRKGTQFCCYDMKKTVTKTPTPKKPKPTIRLPILTPVVTSRPNPTAVPQPSGTPISNDIEPVLNASGEYKILFVSDDDNSEEDIDAFINDFTSTIPKVNLGSIHSKLAFYKLKNIVYKLPCHEPSNDSMDAPICSSQDRDVFVALTTQLRSRYSINKVVYIMNKKVSGEKDNINKLSFTIKEGRNIFVGDSVVSNYYLPVGIFHELGHAIAGLNDEYLTGKIPTVTGPNCADSTTTCDIWKKDYGSSITCDNVCSSPHWYRPSKDSVMRALTYDITVQPDGSTVRKFIQTDYTFNKPSLAAWDKKFGTSLATQSTADTTRLSNDLTLQVAISQTTSGTVKITQTELLNQYPVTASQSTSDGKQPTIKIMNAGGTILYEQPISQYVYNIHSGEETFLADQDMYLPYYESMDSVVITNSSGKELARSSVKDLLSQRQAVITRAQASSSCGNNICQVDMGETPSSCAQDCTGKKTVYDKRLDLLSSDLDSNGVINTLDFVILQKQYGQKQDLEGIKADINHNGVVDAQDSSLITQYLGENTK